jgi:hypothetical protein
LFISGVIGIAFHNSHLLIAVALIIVFYGYLLIYKRTHFKITVIRNLKILYPLLFCSLFLNNTISLIIGKGFSPASGSHVFLIGHLLDTGLLESYLNEKCIEKNYKICAYKDNMPNDFIWDFEHSPLYKTGGWMANKDEYNAIIKDIITTPKYFKKLVIKSIENGFSQLFTFNGGDTPTMIGDYPANNAIKQCFSDQNRAYNSSLQQRGQLNFTVLNNTQKYVVVLSFFAALLILFGLIEAGSEVRLLTLFILSALVINAFVCGCLSGVNARYESRVIWLLPLPALIALFQSQIINRYLHDN